MKACLKWVIGTVHIRYICLSPLVILEVEDITRKCTFGQITKKGGGYRHLPHISFYFYQRGTGPKYGSGVPRLPLKKRLVLDKLIL